MTTKPCFGERSLKHETERRYHNRNDFWIFFSKNTFFIAENIYKIKSKIN